MQNKHNTQHTKVFWLELPVLEAFLDMATYTIFAVVGTEILFSFLHTTTYKIITIFILLIFISNVYAKKCVDIIARYD